MYDVVVVGGGPTGLQGALSLARGQRRVVVLDAGPPRNARAVHLHNFVTRDGIPPSAFRDVAHAELAQYGVEVREARVSAIEGVSGRFVVQTPEGPIDAARVLLAVGMIDVLPPVPGLDALWGHTVFTCPYCHGHEVRGRRWAVWAPIPMMFEMAVVARAWTDDVIALTQGAFPVDDETRARLRAAGIGLDERKVAALEADNAGNLRAVRFEDGAALPRDVVTMRPPQRQTPLVEALGLACDEAGFVAVDAHRQTSVPGIYAAGDLCHPMQAAIIGAAAGAMAGSMINHQLTAERLGWSR